MQRYRAFDVHCIPILPPCVSMEDSKRAVPFSRTPFRNSRLSPWLAKVRAYTTLTSLRWRITWRRFPRFCDSRSASPFCLIFHRVGGFRVPIMASTQRARKRGACGRSEKKNMRKEKETSRASCIHYGGLTAIAVRVADTRRTRAGFDVLLRREEGENSVKIEPCGGKYVFA